MRLAVNTRLLLSHRMEGIARYTYENLKRMVKDHPDDQFVFLFDRPFDPKMIFGPNVEGVVLRPPARHPILYYLWFEWAIPHYLRKNPVDVFLSMDTFMSLSAKVPSVLVTHDIAYKHFPSHMSWVDLMYYKIYFPKYHRAARELVAVSQFTADDVAKAYKLDTKKITVAHNAVPDGFRPLSPYQIKAVRDQYSNGRPYFVYLGSLHPRKNIVRLIEAYNLFRDKRPEQDHALVLIGRMAWKTQEIKRAIENSPYKKDIIHLSNIGDEAKEIVAAATAMVYVSLFEGFGIPILEAMSAEVPVITSEVSSMPEVAGHAAILVDPHDPHSISSAMTYLVDHPESRKHMIESGNRQLASFSWEESANTIYQACRRAAHH